MRTMADTLKLPTQSPFQKRRALCPAAVIARRHPSAVSSTGHLQPLLKKTCPTQITSPSRCSPSPNELTTQKQKGPALIAPAPQNLEVSNTCEMD